MIKHFVSIVLTILSLLFVSFSVSSQGIDNMSKCINVGNALDASNEGDWGITIEDYFFTDIANAGFDTVRIPVRWGSHLGDNNIIDTDFLNRVKEVVDQALSHNLNVIIDVHHFTSLSKSATKANISKLYAIWTQVSEAFQSYNTNTLSFELLNEPYGKVTTYLWNQMLKKTIKIIRKTNPTRKIIVGGTTYNTSGSLASLDFSDIDTSNIIATFHYYLPLNFTHQGQSWISFEEIGSFTDSDKTTAYEKFTTIHSWASAQGIPLLLGEFGVSKSAPSDERLEWLKYISNLADEIDAPWCIWSLADGFGVYNLKTRTFDSSVLNTLGL